jgi:hypothetical protein
MANLKYFREGDGLSLAKFVKDGERVYVVVQWSQAHGLLIHSWQIGQLQRETTVACKYALNKNVKCSSSNSFLGERPFERDSIVFEFLYKELGLNFDENDVPSCGKDGWQKIYNDFGFFRNVMKENGWEEIK